MTATLAYTTTTSIAWASSSKSAQARWRAAGAHRTPSRIWIYEIGFFPTPESRRATLSE